VKPCQARLLSFWSKVPAILSNERLYLAGAAPLSILALPMLLKL